MCAARRDVVDIACGCAACHDMVDIACGCAARRDMVDIACGCAAHTVFPLPARHDMVDIACGCAARHDMVDIACGCAARHDMVDIACGCAARHDMVDIACGCAAPHDMVDIARGCAARHDMVDIACGCAARHDMVDIACGCAARHDMVDISCGCAARRDMVDIACRCAAHTVLALTVATQMFRCRGGGLSRVNSVGRPPCTPRQRMYDHSGVVPLGGCCICLDCYRFAPTVLATSRHGLLPAYTREAGMLKRNCFESLGGYSRAGGDGGCVPGLSVVQCAHSGCGRCAIFPVGRCRTAGRGLLE